MSGQGEEDAEMEDHHLQEGDGLPPTPSPSFGAAAAKDDDNPAAMTHDGTGAAAAAAAAAAEASAYAAPASGGGGGNGSSSGGGGGNGATQASATGASSSSQLQGDAAGAVAGGGTAATASGPAPPRKKKPTLKKRNRTDEATATHAAGGTAAVSGASSSAGGGGGGTASSSRAVNKKRKPPRRGGSSASGAEGGGGKSSSSGVTSSNNPNHQAVRDQMRRALEEDQYSAYGSIVDTDSDSDDGVVPVSGPGAVGGGVEYRGAIVRLDRAAIHQYATQYMATLAAKSSKISTGGGRAIGGGGTAGPGMNPSVAVGAPGVAAAGSFGVSLAYKDGPKGSGTKDSITSARSTPVPVAPASTSTAAAVAPSAAAAASSSSASVMDAMTRELEEEWDLDGGSIFGQTTGASNFTWVECDKCKKWRRLRGVVDEKKLPSRWYCSMNKNDPERNRCSAPEEEYDASHSTPESAADARCRKHLRVWVRRLQCNETYEARQPTQTRGKKKAQSSSKEPYEWIRCCNPSCGKWRSLLRIMEAKSVIEKTQDGEWYCVMNTWDEKVASCAAPQENLPAIGCPPWVLQDDADS